VGKIPERYGSAQDKAEPEVSVWEHKNDYRC
ncbi:hypothetical protein Q6279_30235, partial [Klebsiella variicola]|nr:hypothetical protein [Klebsiella variicola]